MNELERFVSTIQGPRAINAIPNTRKWGVESKTTYSGNYSNKFINR